MALMSSVGSRHCSQSLWVLSSDPKAFQVAPLLPWGVSPPMWVQIFSLNTTHIEPPQISGLSLSVQLFHFWSSILSFQFFEAAGFLLPPLMCHSLKPLSKLKPPAGCNLPCWLPSLRHHRHPLTNEQSFKALSPWVLCSLMTNNKGSYCSWGRWSSKVSEGHIGYGPPKYTNYSSH